MKQPNPTPWLSFLPPATLPPPSNPKLRAFNSPYQSYLIENQQFLDTKSSLKYNFIGQLSLFSSYSSHTSNPTQKTKNFQKQQLVTSLNPQLKYHASPSSTPQNPQLSILSTHSCNCKHTHCLKKYCQCFKSNLRCSPLCKCLQCFNTLGSIQLKQCQLKQKEKLHKEQRQGRIKCNCKKTDCSKKYCECFSTGKKCTSMCNCVECVNQREFALRKQ